MGNHFHLVVETPDPTLGLGMRDMGSRYAHAFNERYKTGGGYVFQGRYGSRLVRTDEQLAQLLRYVGRNPVAAGLCAEPGLWRWSSHSTLAGHRPHPLVAVERVDHLLGALGGQPRTRYARLFEPDGPLGHIDPDLSPWSMRPSLDEILKDAHLTSAVHRARRHGYRLAELAEATGLSESKLSRLARKGSVPF